MIEWLSGIFTSTQGWLFEAVVQPMMFALGMGGLLEDAYGATAWFMMGLIQLIVLVAVLGPLQRWRPVEAMDSASNRASIRVDMVYTLIHRLGLFRVLLFFTLDPIFDEIFGALRTAGFATMHLDQLWPGVTDTAVVSLLIYLVVFDFVAYWTHRGQHQLNWWWQLHSLHHSQRQMTMWSDNRSHVLESLLDDAIMVLVAQLIGVAPEQFILIVVLTQLSESLQHANIRLSFGRIGERLWVSPRFHRLHHSIGLGHETPVRTKHNAVANLPDSVSALPAGAEEPASLGLRRSAPPEGSAAHEGASVGAYKLGGHNFGVLLPWWDMLFGTANFEQRYDPTGIRDQVEANRDYGSGFWSQQWLGMKRLFGRV